MNDHVSMVAAVPPKIIKSQLPEKLIAAQRNPSKMSQSQ